MSALAPITDIDQTAVRFLCRDGYNEFFYPEKFISAAVVASQRFLRSWISQPRSKGVYLAGGSQLKFILDPAIERCLEGECADAPRRRQPGNRPRPALNPTVRASRASRRHGSRRQTAGTFRTNLYKPYEGSGGRGRPHCRIRWFAREM